MQLSKPINALLEEYLSELTKEPATIQLYSRTISLFILWLTKSSFPVKEPSRAAFVLFYKQLREEGKSPRTIDSYTTIIRLFFKWLIDSGYYDKDITDGTKRLNRSADYIRAPLSLDQVVALLKNLKGVTTLQGKRDYAIINLMTFLGLRRCEVSKMNVKDITRQDGKYYFALQGKGRHEKDVMLPATIEIIKPIDEYLNSRQDPWDNESPVFVSHARSGIKRLEPSFFSKLVKRSFMQMGLDDNLYTCHSLRHTAAFLAMEAGATVLETNQMLRQKSLATTEQYLKGHRRGLIKDGSAILKLNEYFRKYKETDPKENKINMPEPQE